MTMGKVLANRDVSVFATPHVWQHRVALDRSQTDSTRSILQQMAVLNSADGGWQVALFGASGFDLPIV